MQDPTENIRRPLVEAVNTQVQSDDKLTERQRLEKHHGQVWDTNQLSDSFEVQGFMAPFVVVKDKTTGKRGTLMFQHSPRFYFSWAEDK